MNTPIHMTCPLLLLLGIGRMPMARAADIDPVAAPGVTTIATPGQSWMVGAEMNWGLALRPPGRRLCPTGRLLLGEELGLALHARFLAGRTPPITADRSSSSASPRGSASSATPTRTSSSIA